MPDVFFRRALPAFALALFASLPASAEIASPEQQAVLSAICAKSDIEGLDCKRARDYPDNDACDVRLFGRSYRIAEDGTQLIVAPYTSDCEVYADNAVGSVILVAKDQSLTLNSYARGIAIPDDCQVVRSDFHSDRLYCVTEFRGRGIIESNLAAYDAQATVAGKYWIESRKTIVSAEDLSGVNGYLSVGCGNRIDFFDLGDLTAGPAPGTLALNVTYADSHVIDAACAPDKPPPDDLVFPPPAGEAFIKPEVAEKARYVYDTRSGKFTTLERFTAPTAAAPPSPPTAEAPTRP